MSLDKVKKCESCNKTVKQQTGCMNCQEESILKAKVKKVMSEFKKGELHSGNGSNVTNPKQAISIALDVARKEVKKSGK